MKKLNSKDAKEIGEDIGINWESVKLSEFTKRNQLQKPDAINGIN